MTYIYHTALRINVTSMMLITHALIHNYQK